MKEFSVKLLEVQALTPDTYRFVFEKPEEYSRYKPGQHATLRLGDLRRPQTLTSLSSEADLEFIIKIYEKRRNLACFFSPWGRT